MVELRKRKTPPPAPAPAAKKKGPPKGTKKGAAAKVKEAVDSAAEKVAAVTTGPTKGEKTAPSKPAGKSVPAAAAGAKKAGAPTAGSTIDLDVFGGEIETNEGKKVTLKSLVEESKAGVVIFTYPKASTPGCTKQACLFRDSYTPLTKTGLSIYGLSTDSPKSNTNFKTKQSLPYPLLCDPKATLLSALGFKGPKGTATRAVFVVEKSGKVLARETGGPDATVKVVEGIVKGMTSEGSDQEMADVAGEVADTAEKIDSNEQ